MSRQSIAVRTAMLAMIALPIAAGVHAPTAAQQQDGGKPVDLNEIIRSLAPISYLPEHGGTPRKASIDIRVLFETGSATLRPEARTQLDELGRALNSEKLKSHRFRIAGHTDASGHARLNKALSWRRALRVADYIVSTHGVDRARLEVVGFGEERLRDPLQPNSAVNRRVEVSLIEPFAPAKPDEEVPQPSTGEVKIRW